MKSLKTELALKSILNGFGRRTSFYTFAAHFPHFFFATKLNNLNLFLPLQHLLLKLIAKDTNLSLKYRST